MKLRAFPLTLLAILLVSCTSIASPTVTPIPTKPPYSSTIFTAVATPVPTDTLLPPTAQTTESASPIPEPIIRNIFLVGINEAGEEINPSIGDLGNFSRFFVPPEKIVTLRFSELQNPEWRLLIYRYRTDNNYANQPAVETNSSTNVSMREIQKKFGDCRAFTIQVVDEQKTLLRQGYFSFSPDTILAKIDTDKAMKEGAIIGYPYSLNESEAAFFREGKFIVIHEPQSGFYRLYYVYNIKLATPEINADLSEVTIRLFSYRNDTSFSVYDSPPIMEKSTQGLGILTIEIPIDFLRENVSSNNIYYLQILDTQANIIKDDYFIFTPYSP